MRNFSHAVVKRTFDHAELTALKEAVDALEEKRRKYVAGKACYDRLGDVFEFAVRAKKKWNICTESIEIIERMIS